MDLVGYSVTTASLGCWEVGGGVLPALGRRDDFSVIRSSNRTARRVGSDGSILTSLQEELDRCSGANVIVTLRKVA